MKTFGLLTLNLLFCLNLFAGGHFGRNDHDKPVTKENFCATCHEMKEVFYEFKKSPHNNKALCTDCHLPYRGFNQSSEYAKSNNFSAVKDEYLGFRYWYHKALAAIQAVEYLNETFDEEVPERVSLKKFMSIAIRIAKNIKKNPDKFINLNMNLMNDIIGTKFPVLEAFYGDGIISHDERHHGAVKAYQQFIDNKSKGCKECHDLPSMMREDKLNPFAKVNHARELKNLKNRQACISCHSGLAHSISGKNNDFELDEEALGTEEYERLKAELLKNE